MKYLLASNKEEVFIEEIDSGWLRTFRYKD